MIILDINVVSELMKPAPSPQVLNWMRDQDQKDLAITVITLAEIYYGLGRLPEGKRREELHRRFEIFIDKGFRDRLLNFGPKAALAYGELCNARLQQGLHVDAFDMMIAAMVYDQSAAIATRNTSDFEGCQITLINPFLG
ncbi:type II toxin-antitoxin system VapC family toxin [Acaryochloris sp. CCMEE 5410]|uniref:type II toxin-antitoxin system VapC family toxin n=1 Tax=Acaryochloris sp. CCMEE 5410 TaxID=310037 RepID=UPI0002484F73|nr:type II toxin-antitoxin system VapC family toxin [Acaryochloris sp. CCMEE 5410]KAI9130530.1 type II toxin-antitoxin system VapC family toxin [Acaryochloris sp. CCMEE 5410]